MTYPCGCWRVPGQDHFCARHFQGILTRAKRTRRSVDDVIVLIRQRAARGGAGDDNNG